MELNVTSWGAFVAGLLSFASPCVLPLVPPYLAFLGGASFAELKGESDDAAARWRVWRRVMVAAIAFVLGFATVFVAMGASASAAGQALRANFDWLAQLAGAIIILFGLHFLGVLRIPFLYRQARLEVSSRPQNVFGAYVVGLAFAFGWTPCVGPVLATILFTAGASGDPAAGASLLFIYALGIGLPFILAAAFTGPFLGAMQRYRRAMGAVEKLMGALLVATGALFLSGAMPKIATWLLDAAPWLGALG